MNVAKNAEYAVFTVCNLAYLQKALVLADSVLRFSGVRLNIVIFDRRVPLDGVASEAEMHWIEEMGVPQFRRLAFKYDIVELSTSLKPFLALKLLETNEKVIFLDPDTCLYHSLDPILHDLSEHSIALTPHYTTPQSDDKSESDVAMMRFGSFNLGFFGVRRSEQALLFLRWWSTRSMQFGYFETQFGLSTDQKWVTIAPCFFTDLYVSRNLGYNVAPWNTFERTLSKGLEGYLVNGTYPLVFFHFSNFDPADPGYLKKRSLIEKGVVRPDLEELGTAYALALTAKMTDSSSAPYSFDYMSGGEYISLTLRRAYASVEEELPPDHDPFDSAGVVGSFARRNHLLEAAGARYVAKGFADIAKHQSMLRYVSVAMRLVLRLIGANRFYDLSRLLVYLSSYRQNRGLWKY